jgi:ribosomal protein L12E/L44/L45/RPP1/RPP2
MRPLAVLFTTILTAVPVRAQQQPPSSPPESTSTTQDAKNAQDAKDRESNLPVSLDKIREQLQQTPLLTLRIDERPIFRVQILERQKIEELLASMNFKAGPVPAGGIYMYEQQRLMFNPVDRPLIQPFAAFSGGELLTILVENLVGKYLAGKVVGAVSKAERARAEAAAREEVNAAIAEYCNAQPNGGAGVQICVSLGR